MTNDLVRFRRGDLVISVLSGDYGKPRPAVVVQADLFNDSHASVVLCPLSSDIRDLPLFRVVLPAANVRGLDRDSEVMVDKIGAVDRRRVRRRIGRLSPAQMQSVNQALRLWLELPSRNEAGT
jgi:mRNA interferase MazF